VVATELTVHPIVRTGKVLAAAAANADGNFFHNDGHTFLYVKNAHTSSWVLTFDTPGSVDGLAVAQRTVTVVNATEVLIGPFPANVYNDANARVQVTYGGVTALTVEALRL